MKTILVALAVSASALVAIAPASAASYNNFNGITGTYGDDAVSESPFAQLFTFVVPTAGRISSTITSSRTSNLTNIDFTRVRLTGPGGFLANYAPVSRGTFEFRTLEGTILQGGTYTLDVRGTSGGMASYTGDFTFAAGVPEPATWGLMILGFGAVGGVMRRRRSVAAQVRFA